MIIALDATPLHTPFGGIRRYTQELHLALTREFPQDQFLLLTDQGQALRRLHRKWWLHGLPESLKRNKATLFHGTDFAVPYRPTVPAVMTIHDLTPWRYPAETSSRVRRRTPWLLKLGLVRRVITPSEAVRREVISKFRLDEQNVRAVPLGVSAEFQPVQTRPAEPYFLVAGATADRKNIATALEAYRHLGLPARLIITGIRHNSTLPHDLPGLDKTNPSDQDMPALYAGATALLMPSLYEGFGLPILEAMACGTPVIASPDPALLETAGGAALHIAPHDVRAWTEAMRALLQSTERTQTLRQAGLRRAAQFPWSRTAQLTHEVYEDALRRSR